MRENNDEEKARGNFIYLFVDSKSKYKAISIDLWPLNVNARSFAGECEWLDKEYAKEV